MVQEWSLGGRCWCESVKGRRQCCKMVWFDWCVPSRGLYSFYTYSEIAENWSSGVVSCDLNFRSCFLTPFGLFVGSRQMQHYISRGKE
jgi:hypothetical protein